MSSPSTIACLGLFLLGANCQSVPQRPSNDFSTWFPITEFPNAQAANVSRWQSEAQRIAGIDLWAQFYHRCVNADHKYPEIGSTLDGFVAPARTFDSLFFVGSSRVSSWAIDTGDGLILIDSLWNREEAEKVIIPGLQSFGYSGHDIKALVITHEHGNHYGGAPWLQTEFGESMNVYCSELCWMGMTQNGDGPIRDEVLADEQELTIGNTTLQFFSTPGHTEGTFSILIPVYDRGQRHLAGLYGGGGVPEDPEDKEKQISSFQRFRRIATDRGVDVLLSNHQSQDNTLQHLDVLANRVCNNEGECSISNPYLVGTERYSRYLELMEMCVRIKAAREGQDLGI